MGRESEILNLQMAISQYVSKGNPARYYDGNPFKRLVELDPEAAANEAQRWQNMHDSQLCDVYHYPASWMTNESREYSKDTADRSAATRDSLIAAGARPPVHKPCGHEERVTTSPIPQKSKPAKRWFTKK